MADQVLRIPEVARRLDIEGIEVYKLIERGELKAGKGPDGLVYVHEAALDDYRQASAATS